MLVGICGLDTVGLDTGGFGYLWGSLLTVNGLSSRLILLRGGRVRVITLDLYLFLSAIKELN